MAIQVLSSGSENRKPGFTPRSGQTFYAGRPVNLDPADSTGQTLMTGDGTTLAIGLALETTAAAADPAVFYDDYHRGGLISYVCGMGVEVDVWNDGRGAIFDAAQTYIVGQSLYNGATNLITNQSNGTAIGTCTKVPTSSTDTLRMKLLI